LLTTVVTLQALVGNLPYSANEDDIAHFFEQCGVTDIYLVRDRDTGDPRGFGYVTFGEREGLVHALTMADGALGGRNIRVEVAKARPGDRAGGRRGGGGYGSSGFSGGRRGYDQPQGGDRYGGG
ncbi:unnamed protein product, partial [Sphacelaria rigidula]